MDYSPKSKAKIQVQVLAGAFKFTIKMKTKEETTENLKELLKQASETYKQNFPMQTWFGRCIFLSWYCKKGTCKFCFRSTMHHKIKHAENAKRSVESVIVDSIIGKNLGWPIEFLTGGYGIFDFNKIVEIAKIVSKIYEHKIWINLGTLKKEELEQLKPYVEGVCASIETAEPKLHDEICPDKQIQPYFDMLKTAESLGFKKSITIVIGLGEKKEDINYLFDMIEQLKLDRITFYALKPIRGTPYTVSPSPEYYAWWIAQTRIRFPNLYIMAGLTPKNPDYAEIILKAGANAITKFPAIKKFNSKEAISIEQQARAAGRIFKGSLTKIPKIDWQKEIDKLDINQQMKKTVAEKLLQSLSSMDSSIKSL